MSTESTTTESPWTDEVRIEAAETLYDLPTPDLDLTPKQLMRAVRGPSFKRQADIVLDSPSVLARVAELQRAAKVEAWDEGFLSGRGTSNPHHPMLRRNPYRRADAIERGES